MSGADTVNDSAGNDVLSFFGTTGGNISAASLGSVSGIEAINLAGGGNTLNLSASRVVALSDNDVLGVFGSGNDSLWFEDASSWTLSATEGDFVTFTTSVGGNATVIAAQSLLPAGSSFFLGEDNDSVEGTFGSDTIDLMAGNDTVFGRNGSDSILGADGNDCINGEGGADTVYGGSGADSVTGGNGNDRIFGEAGNDRIDGGDGNDTLSGGEGNDIFLVSDSLDQIIENSGGGADTIITSASITMPDHVEALQITAGVSGITVTGGAGNDMLIGNGLANNFVGGAGDDVILVGNMTLSDLYALFAT
ncbi:MAG: hypothetical protein INF55_06410 [Roseomonas sp.]|nr:hypothetical protein [Roseomonas sp.]MCA3334392.1 hypothetical protein [Roseomonas sp.]MCA3386432.1 hypothetical protein [Roseomonas sp.]MCA3398044.1 hypothetical protein [Roseomonas sp.]MCA3401526.1 hypothetical protein [Roseomonas sp.]